MDEKWPIFSSTETVLKNAKIEVLRYIPVNICFPWKRQICLKMYSKIIQTCSWINFKKIDNFGGFFLDITETLPLFEVSSSPKAENGVKYY